MRSDPTRPRGVVPCAGRKMDTKNPAPVLRLVWSNPAPKPRLRVDLAFAVERHLSGADGLTREQFLAVYSGRRAQLGLAPLPSAR